MTQAKKTILLIEDSEYARILASEALQSGGFEVRTANGHLDLESKIQEDAGFLHGIDLIILDMVLVESHQRMREDKEGTHQGVSMTGSQIGATLALSHPHLKSVPFLIYSAKEQSEIQSHLDELAEFAEFDQHINDNYKGFIPKRSDSGKVLLEQARQLLLG